MTYKKYLPSEESQALLSRTLDVQHPILDLVDENTVRGRWFNRFIMVMILLNVFLFFATTTAPFYRHHRFLLEAFEFVSVVIFIFEYSLRIYVAPKRHIDMSPVMARTMFVCSFYGIVDLTGFLPYLLTFLEPSDHVSLAVVRILRILRVFRAEGQYFEAFTLCDDVLRANARMLKVTGFTGLVVWLFLATFNYLAERQNPALDGQYSTLLGTLWWTLVNLNGEFPISAELTVWGKVIAGCTAVAAVGVFAIPTGVLGAGLKDMFSEKRAEAAVEEAQAGASAFSTELCNPCAERHMQTAPWQERLWWHMDGHSWLGRQIDRFMLVLILLNVLVFAVSTVPNFHHERALFWFETASVLIFSVEFAVNVYACAADPRYSGSFGRLAYVFSFYGLVDLCAIVPWWVDLVYTGDISPTSFLRALRLVKLLSVDIEAVALFREVYALQRDLIWTAAFLGLVVWVSFASLMYFAEQRNTDPEMRAEFSTGAGSAWLVLLNLTGEYPLANYALWGRLLSVLSSLCAIGVFAIPTGIVADGLEAALAKREKVAEERFKDPPLCAICRCGVDQMNGTAPVVPMADPADSVVVESPDKEDEHPLLQGAGCRRAVFRFLNADTPAGRSFERLVLGLIVVNILCLILSTEPSFMKAHPTLAPGFNSVEWATMLLFTAEYAARLWACPEDPKARRGGWGPYVQHVTSFYAVVDLLAILPFWVDELSPSISIAPTTVVRVFRLLTLLRGEKYGPAFSLLDDVFMAKRAILACTGCLAAVLVVVFATLLHYTERDNPVKVGGLTYAERYVDVPHALFYTALHLTGDYPLYQYTGWGRVVCFAMIVTAAGIVGIPTGAIAQGFQELVEATRKAPAADPQHEASVDIRLGYLDSFCRPCRVTEAKRKGLRAQVYTFLHGDTLGGAVFNRAIVAVIGLSVLAFGLQTDKDIARALGPGPFSYIEKFSGALFTVEYLLRVYAAPEDPDYGGRLQYATSTLALIDLAAILPFYTGLFLGKAPGWSMVLRSLRLIRLLKMEHYLEAFTLFDNVLARCSGVLVTTGVAALIVWVGSATLFWALEAGNPLSEGRLDTLGSSLFYTLLFLGGEWAICDFSVPGQLLGIAVCIAGIGLFAVPTGVLYGGFEEMLALKRSTQERQRRGALCAGCGSPIRHFLHHRTQDG
jgi:hypothetical protein